MAENQEKVKKPIYKKWWFWLIIILIVIVIATNGSQNTSSNNQSASTSTDTSSTTQEDSTTADTKQSYNVGETYQDKSVSIKFLSVDDNFTGYNKYADVKSGCKIIKADFEFENVGTSDVLASSYNFDCYADGYDCEAFWSVDDSSFSSSLSSGKKAKGTVYFQVPVDATSITLEYETNAWTSNKVIFNVK